MGWLSISSGEPGTGCQSPWELEVEKGRKKKAATAKTKAVDTGFRLAERVDAHCAHDNDRSTLRDFGHRGRRSESGRAMTFTGVGPGRASLRALEWLASVGASPPEPLRLVMDAASASRMTTSAASKLPGSCIASRCDTVKAG